LRRATPSKKAAKPTKTFTPISQDYDPQLFALLKQKRLELAKAQNLPPYVIFHDKTLRELATTKPRTAEAMTKISGIGEVKMTRYGETFLEVIAGFELEIV
jgi:ATP-dependent DNA helicase RecQ